MIESTTNFASRSIIVLGMHRSGTSALTGVLSHLGADPGSSLIAGIEGVNPKGFWEHSEVVNVHNNLLTALGSSWDDERALPNGWWRSSVAGEFRTHLEEILLRDFGNSRLWILKDPRICRLLPLWNVILENLNTKPHFVICLRHPSEVARSLEVRDGIVRTRAYLLWLQHLLESERCTRGYPRIVVTYDELLSDWRSVARRIIEDLRLPLEIPSADRRISDFVEPSLKHQSGASTADETEAICRLANNAYDLATSTNVDELEFSLESTAAQVEEVLMNAAPWITQIQKLHHEIAELRLREMRLRRIEVELQRIKSTVSWRITKPLRLLAHLSGRKPLSRQK